MKSLTLSEIENAVRVMAGLQHLYYIEQLTLADGTRETMSRELDDKGEEAIGIANTPYTIENKDYGHKYMTEYVAWLRGKLEKPIRCSVLYVFNDTSFLDSQIEDCIKVIEESLYNFFIDESVKGVISGRAIADGIYWIQEFKQWVYKTHNQGEED